MKMLAAIQFLIFFSFVLFSSRNYNLKDPNFLLEDRILNDKDNILFNNSNSTQENVNYSLNLISANTTNCSQYTTPFSCLHFYGCLWHRISYSNYSGFCKPFNESELYSGKFCWKTVLSETNFTQVTFGKNDDWDPYQWNYYGTNYTFL